VSLSQYLGTYVSLVIRRFGSPGAFLALDETSQGEAHSDDSFSDSSEALHGAGAGDDDTAATDQEPPPEYFPEQDFADDELVDDSFRSADHSARPEREPVVLLPGAEIPEGAMVGDSLLVFLYLDSEGRPVTTLQRPRLALGEVAFLTVTARTAIGAFVDWGLGKELLVPFAEQTREVEVGERHPVALYIDPSGRLAGTMRVREFLHKTPLAFGPGAWVDGEAWRNEQENQVGLFVIIEKTHIGLVPHEEPHRLTRGESASFRVARILPDGKVTLSLRSLAHEERGGDGDHILQALQAESPPQIGDKSDPEEIRALFGLSKKAFKRAVGGLLKKGSVAINHQGHLIAKK
jgi:uncharacterized protein